MHFPISTHWPTVVYVWVGQISCSSVCSTMWCSALHIWMHKWSASLPRLKWWHSQRATFDDASHALMQQCITDKQKTCLTVQTLHHTSQVCHKQEVKPHNWYIKMWIWAKVLSRLIRFACYRSPPSCPPSPPHSSLTILFDWWVYWMRNECLLLSPFCIFQNPTDPLSLMHWLPVHSCHISP